MPPNITQLLQKYLELAGLALLVVFIFTVVTVHFCCPPPASADIYMDIESSLIKEIDSLGNLSNDLMAVEDAGKALTADMKTYQNDMKPLSAKPAPPAPLEKGTAPPAKAPAKGDDKAKPDDPDDSSTGSDMMKKLIMVLLKLSQYAFMLVIIRAVTPTGKYTIFFLVYCIILNTCKK